jgi:hypothetical protein
MKASKVAMLGYCGLLAGKLRVVGCSLLALPCDKILVNEKIRHRLEMHARKRSMVLKYV